MAATGMWEVAGGYPILSNWQNAYVALGLLHIYAMTGDTNCRKGAAYMLQLQAHFIAVTSAYTAAVYNYAALATTTSVPIVDTVPLANDLLLGGTGPQIIWDTAHGITMIGGGQTPYIPTVDDVVMFFGTLTLPALASTPIPAGFSSFTPYHIVSSTRIPMTTLQTSISSSVTSISVASSAGFPGTAPFTIVVNSEQMTVTGGAGTLTWTVTRGAGGTTAASHNSNSVITAPAETTTVGTTSLIQLSANHGGSPIAVTDSWTGAPRDLFTHIATSPPSTGFYALPVYAPIVLGAFNYGTALGASSQAPPTAPAGELANAISALTTRAGAPAAYGFAKWFLKNTY